MAENDWLIELTAGLDENKSREQIAKDLEKIIKNLAVALKVGKIELDEKQENTIKAQLDKLAISLKDISVNKGALNSLVAQVNNALSKIEIKGFSITGGNVANQAENVGQQIGDNLLAGASQEINKGSNILDNFIKSLLHIGMEPTFVTNIAEEIQSLDIQIETLKQTTNDKDGLSVKIGGLDSLKNAVEYTARFNTKTGELLDLIKSVSTAQQKAGTTADTFIEKQQKAVAEAKNHLSTIETKLNDKNVAKSLANTNFDTNGLNEQLEKTKAAVQNLGNATKDNFTQAQIEVDNEITALNNLITKLKNAEYAATSLRTKDITTIKVDEGNLLDAFVQKMEQSGHYTNDLKNKVETLKDDLNKVFDANSLTNYLNKLSNLQSEFKKIDATAKTSEIGSKLQANINSEKKILQIYKNELKEAGILTGEVKEQIQNMFYSLSKVDSQNGLIIWRAELKGVKAEIDSVLKSASEFSQKKINRIKFSIDENGEIATKIQSLKNKFTELGLSEDQVADKMSDVNNQLDKLKEAITENDSARIHSQFDELNAALSKTQNVLTLTKSELDSINKNAKLDIKISGLKSDIENLKRINPEISNFKTQINGAEISIESLLNDLSKVNTASDFSVVSNKFTAFKKAAKSAGIATSEFANIIKSQLKQVENAFMQTFSIAAIGMKAISKTKEAITELKEVDTYLTEISKANDKLTAAELKAIGNNSFDVASKYGKAATDYLAGIQEASRAGYANAEGIAELSVAAQGAGDMTAELANQYIIATDKAYKLGGSVEKLTEILDGSNYITNHNAVNMKELAEGMSIVGTQAASFGVEANETTAALGTMIAVTQQSGSEMARAFRGILLNLRQVTDEEEGIDAEGLTKYEEACKALNVSLKETKNGITALRDPMEVLKELSVEYSKLDSNDIRRTNLLNSVGGKLRSNALDALLSNYGMYTKMLEQYAQGAGSMAEEAEKTANSWEGALNRISNTWTDTVQNVADSDAIIAAINGLNGILSVVNNITEALGSWGTIGAGIGIAASIKNVGRDKKYSLIC